MSDIQQPQAPIPPAPTGMTFDQLKGKLLKNFENMYFQFMNQLTTIPHNPDNWPQARGHFDDGFFNFCAAIQRLRLEDVVVPAPKQPQVPSEPPANQEVPPTDQPEAPPAV